MKFKAGDIVRLTSSYTKSSYTNMVVRYAYLNGPDKIPTYLVEDPYGWCGTWEEVNLELYVDPKIEQVAKAMFESVDRSWETADDWLREEYLDMADTAISAMNNEQEDSTNE